MTLGHKVTAGAAVVLLLLLAFVGYNWLQAHDANLKAQSQTSAQQKDVDALKEQQKEVAATLQDTLKAIQAQRQAPPPTPQQVVVDVSKLMPALPVPVTVQTAPAKTVTQPDGSTVVEAPHQQIVIDEKDIPAFKSYKLACDESAARLTACSVTEQDEKEKLILTEQQRDEWKKAAKGGSFWHRTMVAAKWVGVGAAVGVVAGYAAHK